jgi:hypothetical protein
MKQKEISIFMLSDGDRKIPMNASFGDSSETAKDDRRQSILYPTN